MFSYPASFCKHTRLNRREKQFNGVYKALDGIRGDSDNRTNGTYQAIAVNALLEFNGSVFFVGRRR